MSGQSGRQLAYLSIHPSGSLCLLMCRAQRMYRVALLYANFEAKEQNKTSQTLNREEEENQRLCCFWYELTKIGKEFNTLI